LQRPGKIPLFVAETLNILITLFWVVGITNAMNMIDSMDGIVAGLGVIAFACFFRRNHTGGSDRARGLVGRPVGD
jgi:UDP-N-acetylmuramyl pentapeptide phosphotransferase/UDP-N-acetylglucosamine-1-phosphate transferase